MAKRRKPARRRTLSAKAVEPSTRVEDLLPPLTEFEVTMLRLAAEAETNPGQLAALRAAYPEPSSVLGAVAAVNPFRDIQESLERAHQARIDEEVAIRRGVAAALKAGKASRSERRKAWARFWTKYPADLEFTPDGEPVTARWRCERILEEFGVSVTRSPMSKARTKELARLHRSRSPQK
jgi:hypothetical protein